jgi:hypothetical protein
MAPLHFRWRALVPVLGLGAWVAGAALAPVRAQGLVVSEDDLVYVKQLDLSLNPARRSEQEAPHPATPPPPENEEPVQRQLNLPALSSPAGSREVARVIGGIEAKPGAWNSAVHVTYRRAHIDRATGTAYQGNGSCGATVIDSHWALTAAHCFFVRDQGGLRSLEWATVYAGSTYSSTQVRRGRAIRVVEAHVHRQFREANKQITYDVALLKLETNAGAPRQKLTAQRGQSTFLTEANMATVVGWGKTDALVPGSASPVLLQANVPIVGQAACQRIYPDIGEVAFCAGYPEGHIDACQGDSGGPLFVAGSNGEALQAGITSFGRGCARPNTYGVYTNVGRFEQWIRERVPDAYFALPPAAEPGSPLAQIAGATPGGPPAPHGQVSVDLDVHACGTAGAPFKGGTAAKAATNRVKAGSCITFHVTSGVTGHLGVFSRNALGKVDQVFPNRWGGGGQAGAAPTRVRAGQVVTIPGPGDAVQFPVSAPFGRAEVIAVVVPDAVGLPAATQPYKGALRSVESFEGELADIVRQVNVVPTAPRAVGTRQYEVVE